MFLILLFPGILVLQRGINSNIIKPIRPIVNTVPLVKIEGIKKR